RLTQDVKTAGSAITTGNYFYDPNGNQLARVSETLASAGNTTSQVGIDPSGVELYEYDGRNRQVYSNVNGEAVFYTYRADGLRNSKETAAGKTTHLWDGASIAADLNGGTVVARYVRGINLLLSETAGTQKFFLLNGHGDVVQLASSAGVILWQYDFDSFGNEREIAGQDAALDTNPWRYCGEYLDLETNTYYLRARNYQPILGRFLTEDPIRDGQNWYIYAGNNPLFYLDPFGLWNIPIRDFVAMYANYGGSFYFDNDSRISVFEIGKIKLATTYAGDNLHDINIWNDGGYLWADTNQLCDYFQTDRFIPSIAEEGLKQDWLFNGILFVGSAGGAYAGLSAIGAIGGEAVVPVATAAGSGGAAVGTGALTIPNYVNNASTFISWSRTFESAKQVLSISQVQQLARMANQYGVRVSATIEDLAGHGAWSIPHIHIIGNIARVHIAVAKEAVEWIIEHLL
ncbi:MAG: RHS repeat-associated core domain-containing protein, partial [Firmicutes bacterium]|nr:RHS repeat-associated core domain-containing protein [Bacillota bacterium]